MLPHVEVITHKLVQKFSRWKDFTAQHRERESDSEHTRRLKVELRIHARKMDEMKLLLEREKEKVALEKTRLSVLMRQQRGETPGSLLLKSLTSSQQQLLLGRNSSQFYTSPARSTGAARTSPVRADVSPARFDASQYRSSTASPSANVSRERAAIIAHRFLAVMSTLLRLQPGVRARAAPLLQITSRYCPTSRRPPCGVIRQ